jgi:hypothetical protein
MIRPTQPQSSTTPRPAHDVRLYDSTTRGRWVCEPDDRGTGVPFPLPSSPFPESSGASCRTLPYHRPTPEQSRCSHNPHRRSNWRASREKECWEQDKRTDVQLPRPSSPFPESKS